jgi:hypothetical protein
MSLEQRDKYILPDSIRQSPLMEGLQIKPQDGGLGPRAGASGSPPAGQPAPSAGKPQKPAEKEQYGPRPKTYGPVINRPGPSSTTSVPVFGPVIAKGVADPKTGD